MGINYRVLETGRASGLASGASQHSVSDDRSHLVLCTGTRSVRSPEGSSAPKKGVAAGSSGSAMEVRLGGGS